MTKTLDIAVVLAEFPALSETFVLDQITGLIDLGHSVSIFADRGRADAGQHSAVETYQLLERTHYWSWLTFQMLGGGKNSTSFWVIRSALLRMLAPSLEGRRLFDIVLCHFGPTGLRALALRDAGVLDGKIVTFFHGYDVSQFIKIRGEKVYDRLFAKGDYFLPISEYWQSKLIALGCPKGRIDVHRMGIELGRFKFVRRRTTPDEPIRFVSVARLVEKKGIQYAIRAFDLLARRHPELPVRYTVIGDGPLREELQTEASQSAAGQVIEFVGSKESCGIAAALSNAHIFLAPSVTAEDGDQEGIPVAIMEAMATGLPVITTYHTGIPELVGDGKSGFLVREKDASELAERMYDVATNPGRWAAIGDAARERVAALHDTRRLNLELETILRKLCEEKRRS